MRTAIILATERMEARREDAHANECFSQFPSALSKNCQNALIYKLHKFTLKRGGRVV